MATIHLTGTRKGGGGWMWWLICFSISKRFYFHWKAFDLVNKMRLLEVCDVTKQGRQLGFHQELEIREKPRELVIFLA